jgi:hypothetical protein
MLERFGWRRSNAAGNAQTNDEDRGAHHYRKFLQSSACSADQLV